MLTWPSARERKAILSLHRRPILEAVRDRRTIFIAVFFNLAASVLPASAQDAVTLFFSVDPSVGGYSIEWRMEGSDIWAGFPDDQMLVNCTGDGDCSAFLTGIPQDGTILFRVGVTNSDGTAFRYDAGAWYCGDCAPATDMPLAPGIE